MRLKKFTSIHFVANKSYINNLRFAMSKFNWKFLLKTKTQILELYALPALRMLQLSSKRYKYGYTLRYNYVCFQTIKILTGVVTNFYLEQSIQEWINKNLWKAAFKKFYLVHSWVLCPISPEISIKTYTFWWFQGK